MKQHKPTAVESLEIWLSTKPYWEQYVWKLNLEKETLTDEDLAQCYRYLSEHLELIPTSPGKKLALSFKHQVVAAPESVIGPPKIKIREVKDFVDVNAISKRCSVKFGPSLTLIYGGNGSGKSGVGRLLCNACFSRGDREILPNVKTGSSTAQSVAKATFVIEDEAGTPTEIDYALGDNDENLKRFSVFDSKSILIHLDQSNNVNFTPAQVKIFDKVADTISKLEEKLTSERNAKKKDNPFQSMFLENATTDIAVFCKNISASTKEADFLKHASFDPKVDGAAVTELESQIEAKKKLDIPKKRSQLATDCQNLEALKASLEKVVNRFTPQKMTETNALITDILEKKKLVESLSAASFDDGLFKCIGSAEWKSLITAAKSLYDAEKLANAGKKLSHCMLCHQELTKEAQSLFERYWEFLQSKAESELSQSDKKRTDLLQQLKSVKAMYPQFLATDAGVKLLNDEDAPCLARLKVQFGTLSGVLTDWISQIGKLQTVNRKEVPVIDLSKIDALVATKTDEQSKLVDPSGEIATLSAKLNSLKHKKEVAAVKDAALEYMDFLRWQSKANRAGFASIKMATTKKRTELFLTGVAKDYKGAFNQELAKLGCDFNLVMNTSGEHGATVREYRLDFAENYSPSEILSEGEQNACSLADFLTETQLDGNNCGIIFDDPVTSLDHERKDKIAQRLAIEAGQRQVVVLTHDIAFMSQLVKHADKYNVPLVAHWMRKVDGVPGCIKENESPKMASVKSLKADCQVAIKGYDSLPPKEQERALGAAFDYLRSACEALIEEVLYAGTMQRYEDHIRVQNLEEAIFDQNAALKIVDLHGRLSEVLLAHNRSDLQRENLPSLADLNALLKEFEALEKELRELRKAAQKARVARKDAKEKARGGW